MNRFIKMLDQFPPGEIYSLQSLTLIRVFGEDAAQFLHQQLSNAVTDLDSSSIRLGGLCSVKGRLLASMHYWKQDDAVMLLVSRDLSLAFVKRLSMFILRARVKIEIIDEAYHIVPLIGKREEAADKKTPANFPKVANVVDLPLGKLLRFENTNVFCRFLWIVPVQADKAQIAAAFPYTSYLQVIDQSGWDDLEVCAGVPRITLPTQDQFVPQMINFELVGGINFKKGCYPGQEIVARTQYRGTVKRRLQLACVNLSEDDKVVSVTAGMELFHSDDPAQPCGMVVNAARQLFLEHETSAPLNRWDMLVEIKLSALESGWVYLKERGGPSLSFLALPYEIIAE